MDGLMRGWMNGCVDCCNCVCRLVTDLSPFVQDYKFFDSKKFEFVVSEYHLDMLPLERDVISLDIKTAFKVFATAQPHQLHTSLAHYLSSMSNS